MRGSNLFAGQAVQIRPLNGGITNRNFVASTDRGDSTSCASPASAPQLLGIDRAYEAEAARTAPRDLGIGPAVLGDAAPASAPSVTELVDGHHLERRAVHPQRLDDIVALVLQLHRSGPLRGPGSRSTASSNGMPVMRAAHGVMPPTCGPAAAKAEKPAHRGSLLGLSDAAGAVPQRPPPQQRAVRRRARVAARLRVLGVWTMRSSTARCRQRQRRVSARCRRSPADRNTSAA